MQTALCKSSTRVNSDNHILYHQSRQKRKAEHQQQRSTSSSSTTLCDYCKKCNHIKVDCMMRANDMKVGLFLPYSMAKWRNDNIRAIQELLKQKGTNPNFQPKFWFLATGPDGTSYMDHPKQSANIVIENDVHDFKDPTSALTYDDSFVFCALTH